MFFLVCYGSQSVAQKKVAIDWNKPADLGSFNQELSFFKNHNVAYLFVDHPLTGDEIAALDQTGISFFVKLDQIFVTETEFLNNIDQYLESVTTSKAYYDSSLSFNGIIAFSHSNVSLDAINSTDVLEIKGSDVYSQNDITNPVFRYFKPANSYSISVNALKKSLMDSDSIIVLNSDWYISTLSENPELESAFSENSGIFPSTIAAPKLPDNSPKVHWSVVVLVLLWISLAINVATNPTYLETIPRYFTAHRFFADDIMSYRERSSASALFLFFQHAVFGGLVTYILAKMFISTIGLEALYFHLPYLAILGKNYFSLFILSTALVMLVELIALMWLYLPNKEMTHFNQALNLFTWIFHLDFILITLMITAYFAGWNSSFILIIAISYILIWFSSFNITAFDASKKLGMNRNTYLFKTIGFHTIVSLGLVILLAIFDGWWDVLELVISV